MNDDPYVHPLTSDSQFGFPLFDEVPKNTAGLLIDGSDPGVEDLFGDEPPCISTTNLPSPVGFFPYVPPGSCPPHPDCLCPECQYWAGYRPVTDPLEASVAPPPRPKEKVDAQAQTTHHSKRPHSRSTRHRHSGRPRSNQRQEPFYAHSNSHDQLRSAISHRSGTNACCPRLVTCRQNYVCLPLPPASPRTPGACQYTPKAMGGKLVSNGMPEAESPSLLDVTGVLSPTSSSHIPPASSGPRLSDAGSTPSESSSIRVAHSKVMAGKDGKAHLGDNSSMCQPRICSQSACKCTQPIPTPTISLSNSTEDETLVITGAIPDTPLSILHPLEPKRGEETNCNGSSHSKSIFEYHEDPSAKKDSASTSTPTQTPAHRIVCLHHQAHIPLELQIFYRLHRITDRTDLTEQLMSTTRPEPQKLIQPHRAAGDEIPAANHSRKGTQRRKKKTNRTRLLEGALNTLLTPGDHYEGGLGDSHLDLGEFSLELNDPFGMQNFTVFANA
eukprot:GHVN01057986.1.p2 GENE.GHVN01057986.1~~GHVN01057986.1.p2  ORF type:complete len:499 (+),score=59.89 GHVN01057986.1:3101-4597(+)